MLFAVTHLSVTILLTLLLPLDQTLRPFSQTGSAFCLSIRVTPAFAVCIFNASCRYPRALVLAVYHTPVGSVTARANFNNNLSLSLLSTTISERKGDMSSALHRDRVRKRRSKRNAGSVGKAEQGKYVKSGIGGYRFGEGLER